MTYDVRANLRLKLCHSPQAPVSTLSSLFVYFLSVSSAAPLLEVRGRGRGQTRTGAHRYLLLLLRPYLWRKPPPWLSHEPLYYSLWLLWDGYCTFKKVSMSTLRNFMAHGFSCQYGLCFSLLHSCTPAPLHCRYLEPGQHYAMQLDNLLRALSRKVHSVSRSLWTVKEKGGITQYLCGVKNDKTVANWLLNCDVRVGPLSALLGCKCLISVHLNRLDLCKPQMERWILLPSTLTQSVEDFQWM